jgi:DegV family protein with EDD domain
VTTRLTLANTALVVDSTCDPPDDYLERNGVFMVPLTVHFGDETYRDHVDLSFDEFKAKLLAAAVLPTTSQPTAAEFKKVYAEIAHRYEHVFSLHISHKMSGTYAAAEAAATEFANVEAIDTRVVSTTITMLVARLRARLEAGIGLDEARAYIAAFGLNSHTIIHAGTLEYLRRGGRIGAAASVIGGLLGIHPVIQVANGEISPYAKARGPQRAQAAMVDYLSAHSTADDKLFVCLIDAMSDLGALDSLRADILAARPNARILMTGRTGAVVGTHIGPGTSAFGMIVE